MRTIGVSKLFTVVALTAAWAAAVGAQAQVTTREAAIEQAQAERAKSLHPYVPNTVEKFLDHLDYVLANGTPTWHPFLDSAYSGGGFTLGAGYAHHVSSYNTVDVRGSYSIAGYKRAELEFVAPRMFHRRAALSLLGGWREATQVGFYGIGNDTSRDQRTNFDFQQPHASATFTIFPTRRNLMLRGGAEWSEWSQRPGQGAFPSVETIYTPGTLPGLGSTTTYLHSQGTVGFDWRTSPGYTRRGGFYGVTVHDYRDGDQAFGFKQVDYEAIQHLPILREAWVISLHSLVQTAFNKSGQQIPFFMLPATGGGHSLRGYSSSRFRDQNSLLLQAEWRIMANRFLDAAVFYDAGTVAARRSDLDLGSLKSNYGFGLRFHGPLGTPLRVELARSKEEKLAFIFSAGPSF